MALITVKEAAARLGLSERSIRRQLEAGKLAGEKIPGIGGDGKVWMVEDSVLTPSKTVEQKQKRPRTGEKKMSVVPRTTPDTTTDTMSVVPNSRNKRGLENGLWLSFGEVLGLYFANNVTNQPCDVTLSTKILTQTDLVDKKRGVFERFLGVLVDGDLSTKPEGCAGEAGSDPKERAVTPDGVEQFNWRHTAECRQLFRDIDSGLLITRKDESDGRKTQVLFSSLPAQLKEIYRLIMVRGKVEAVCSGAVSVAVCHNERGGHPHRDRLLESGQSKRISSAVKQQVVTALWDLRLEKGSFRALLTRVCEHYNISEATVYRWYNQATGKGELDRGALLSRGAHNKGVKRVVFEPEVVRYFLSVLVQEACFRVSFAMRLTMARYGVTMSRRQADELANYDPAYNLLHREMHNPEKSRWLGHFWNPQTRNGLRPLELVTTDGHICDVMVSSPAGDFRPVIVEVYDVATALPLGWAIGRSEDRELVVRAYINAITKFGYIKEIHQDQGKAFLQAESLKQQVREYLHINLVTLPGYSPHLKAHQECNFGRFEEFVGQLLLKKGYVGNSVAKAPKDGVGKSVKAVLSYREYYEMVAQYYEIIAPNVRRESLNNCTPAEVWKKWEAEGFRVQKLFEDERKLYFALVMAFMVRRRVKLRRGVLGFSRGGVKHIYYGGFMAELDGCTVEYCFNPDRPQSVFVFYGGRFMGEGKLLDFVNRVGTIDERTLEIKGDYKDNRKRSLERVKANIDKIDLYDEQMSYCFKNAVGFEPEADIADISELMISQLLDSDYDSSRKALDFTRSDGSGTGHKPRGVFDVFIPEEGYDTEEVVLEEGYEDYEKEDGE